MNNTGGNIHSLDLTNGCGSGTGTGGTCVGVGAAGTVNACGNVVQGGGGGRKRVSWPEDEVQGG